jgi:hypothetical protein
MSNSNIPKMSGDSGHWSLSGNKICVKWKKAHHGKRSCFTIRTRSDGTYVTSSNYIYTVH